MNKYLFIHEIETSLRSHRGEWIFDVNGFNIKLKFKKNGNGTCEAHTEATGESALKLHDGMVNTLAEVLDVVSYVTKSSTFTSGLKTILKSEAGQDARIVFRQTSRIVREGLFITEESYDSIAELLNSNQKLMPLHWLRYAYRARTISEQFTYFWLTLERHVGEEQITVNCPKCAYENTYTNIKKESVKKILLEHGYSVSEFGQLWKSRQKIFHGNIKLSTDFIRTLKEQSDKLGGAVEILIHERLNPLYRVSVGVPMANEMVTNINGFYKFYAADPNEEFAMNFPTDIQLEAFHENTSAIKDEEHGFEVVNFEENINDW